MTGLFGKIHNKQCCCGGYLCCPNISTPLQLYLTLRKISQLCGCLDGQVIPMLPNGTTGGNLHYLAIWQWPCTDLIFPENVTWFKFTTFCNGGSSFLQVITQRIKQLDTDPPPDQGDTRWITEFVYDKDAGQCDPFYFHFNGVPNGDPVWVRCQDDFRDSPEIQMELTL